MKCKLKRERGRKPLFDGAIFLGESILVVANVGGYLRRKPLFDGAIFLGDEDGDPWNGVTIRKPLFDGAIFLGK